MSYYLFWLEYEATNQEDFLNRNPHTTDMDEAYTRMCQHQHQYFAIVKAWLLALYLGSIPFLSTTF